MRVGPPLAIITRSGSLVEVRDAEGRHATRRGNGFGRVGKASMSPGPARGSRRGAG
jgi:hypothetical protein